MSTSCDPGPADSHALSADQLAAWVDNLTSIDTNAPDAALIDQISQLERLKSACAAAQATLTVAFVASQVEGLPAAKARDEQAHRSIAAQVALARKEFPVRGNRLVGLESPHPGDAAHLRRTASRGTQRMAGHPHRKRPRA